LLDVPLPLDSNYYGALELDLRPCALGNPEYPKKAQERNITGTVKVKVLLNEQGTVDEATILLEDPPGWGFGEELLKYLKTGRFAPAIRNGRPVRAQIVYSLAFGESDAERKEREEKKKTEKKRDRDPRCPE